MMSEGWVEQEKKRAGFYAADMVADGMAVGLGTGSTVKFSMERLSERIREGLSITGIPTSYQTAIRAREYGIPLSTLDEYPNLDLAIDGADQVDRYRNLIKGRGGAHVRERCVAAAAKTLFIVIDAGKLADTLSVPVPVEVIPFAAPLVYCALHDLGGKPVLREATRKDGPVMTDNCNWIFDCDFGVLDDPENLECTINNLPGVVGCGIFSEFREKTVIIVGEKGEIREISG